MQTGLNENEQGLISIELPGASSPIELTVTELKPKAPQLTKSNAEIKPDGTADWSVSYIHPTNAYSGERPTEIADLLPQGLLFASDIIVTTQDSGGLKQESLTPSGNSFTYSLPASLEAGACITFSYTTRLSNEEQTNIWLANGNTTKFSYQNKATALNNGAELSPALSASGLLEITKGWQGFKAMAKTGKLIEPSSVLNPTDKWVVNWTVTVNALSQAYKSLTVLDIMGKGFILDESSIKVNSLAANATAVYDADGKTHMSLNLVHNSVPATSEQTYIITYTTAVNQNFFDQPEEGVGLTDEDVTNCAFLIYVWPDGTGPDSGQLAPSVVKPSDIGLSGALIEKSAVGAYNPKTHEFEWMVTVNPNKVDITKALVEDDLSQSAPIHEFVEAAQADIATQLSGLADEVKIENNKLTIRLNSIERQSVTFTFKTRVSDSEIWAGNVKDKVFSNTVKLLKSATLVNNKPILKDGSATATNKATSNVLKKEHTAYNEKTKILTWALTVNENETQLGKVVITDELPEGLAYADGSAKLNNAAFSVPDSFSYDEGTNKITVKLKDVNAKHIITFDTEVDINSDSFINSSTVSIKNKAKIKSDSNQREAFSNESEAKISNQVLTKTSTEPTSSKPRVSYTVMLNPLEMDLQQGVQANALTLTDTLADGLYLDLQTVKLYNAARTQALVNGTYSISLTKDGLVNPAPPIAYNSAQNSFSVTIPNSAKAYILEYDVYVVKAGVELKNEISMGGSLIPEAAANNSAAKTVRLNAFGGAGFELPKKSFFSFRVNKIDQNGAALPGASISLYKNKNDAAPLLTVECDPSTGTATLALPRTAGLASGTKLYWKETEAPAGYAANDEWHEVIVTAPDSTSGILSIDFTNLPVSQATGAEIYIRKTDTAASPLTGAEFALYEDEDCTKLKHTSAKVNADGELKFTGLYPGRNYWVKETKAPGGYVMLKNAVKIQAQQAAPRQDLANEVADVTLKIKKTDASDTSKPLQGAEFALYLDAQATKPFAVKQITNANGECSFVGLSPETDYYIKEIKAPDGYYLLTELTKVTTRENNHEQKIVIANTKLPPNVHKQAKENPKTGT